MLQQHQVGALFGLFVRAIGAARFVRAIAPVAALVAVASIPLPRAASSIDASAPSSGLVQMLAVAQRATSRSHDLVVPVEASHRGSSQRGASDDADGGSAFARIGDRWLQLRNEQRATPRVEDPSPRHVGDRLLHAATTRTADAWAPAAALEAFVLLGDTVKPVAFTGAEPRAPPAGTSQPNDAGGPQPASAKEIARTAPVTDRDSAAAASGATPATSAATGTTKTPPDTLSPLKLSDEQRNISRFVARRYRVNLDDVQHFVAHAYRAASEFRLDPHLVLAVMSIESSFNPNARSSAGAQGLMQVLTRVHLDKFEPFGGARAALDPMANITVGSRILKEYLVREGSIEGALKSYVGAALLPHDFGYGSKVLGERARIAAAARNEANSQSITARAGGRTTKIAMAEQPGESKMKTIVPAGEARPAQQKTQAASDTEAGDARAPSSVAQAQVPAQAQTPQPQAAVPGQTQTPQSQAAAPAQTPQVPAAATAQASEPRASSTPVLMPSEALREL